MTCGMLSCEITSYVESLFKSSILRDVELSCVLLSCEITSCVELWSFHPARCDLTHPAGWWWCSSHR
jgi:hypothetical protein